MFFQKKLQMSFWNLSWPKMIDFWVCTTPSSTLHKYRNILHPFILSVTTLFFSNIYCFFSKSMWLSIILSFCFALSVFPTSHSIYLFIYLSICVPLPLPLSLSYSFPFISLIFLSLYHFINFPLSLSSSSPFISLLFISLYLSLLPLPLSLYSFPPSSFSISSHFINIFQICTLPYE